jgi:plasmid maintenance system antidote protein VapI
LRLAKFFGTDPKFWLSLQADFDLEEALKIKELVLKEIRPMI